MNFISKLSTVGWCVAWRDRVEADVFSVERKFNIIKNPKDAWVADPFPLEYGGELYVFGELYELKSGRGSIAYCMPRKKDCRWVKVIDEPYHMSYPFLFRRNGEIYILPETAQNGTIDLYKAISFPNIWEKETTLRENVRYVDVTPYLEDDLHRALAYIVHPDIVQSELWLISLDRGKADCKICVSCPEIRRPGGRIQEEKNIRVAQDSSVGYGDGLVFYRYDFHAPEEYEEQEIMRIYANELRFSQKIRCNGIHTYNCSDKFECIDLRTNKFLLKNCLRKIWSKVCRRSR